jgi:hypothetical protein
MTPEREQLDERYLEAQLRDELGPPVDLSERVLRSVYGKPRRVVPPPRRIPAWRPLAAAAAVLIAAGLATYVLVNVLPEREQPVRERARSTPAPVVNDKPPQVPGGERTQQPPEVAPEQQPEPQPQPEPVRQPEPKGATQPVPEPDPKTEPEPDDQVEQPKDAPPPEDTIKEGPPPKGWTDPPESWPDPKRYADPREASPVLVAAWKGDSLKLQYAGPDGRVVERKLKAGEAFEFRDGDRVQPKGAADFTLTDGTLVRLDGDLTFGGEASALKLTLHDGALYADTAAPLSISAGELSVTVSGVAVLEERLHGLDVFCVSGSVTAGNENLSAGLQARLGKDGFGRDKKINWADVQREFGFLKDTPARAMLREELAEAPGELFGGALKDGVLAGDTDSETGIGFYLRQPYVTQAGDVVRFRFRVERACEMILQFGTVGDSNWRHKMGGVKAGEWIEYELPLSELYKTTEVSLSAEPGLQLKFFQLHPEDAQTRIEIDWLEIVHRP